MSTILVVDDDAMTLRMLEYSLGNAGHQVLTTSDPGDAAALAAAHRVDAVILDVMMPGRSGYEVMAELHGQAATAGIPVLILSSLSQSADRVKGLREGADEYIGKPFNPEELLLRLNRLLNLQRGDEAEFSGNLATIPFAEVTQSLLHGTTDGVLEVFQGNIRGHVVLEDGRATEATFGRLNGQQALLAMLELSSGNFRFVHRPRDLNATDHGIDLALQQAVFSSVWLQDELGRWPEVAARSALWVTAAEDGPPPSPPGFDHLPMLTVWQEVARHPGVALRELIERGLAAPSVLRLTVRVLVHTGALTSTQPRSGETDSGAFDRRVLALRSAVAATIQTSRSRGSTGDIVHVLLMVDRTVTAELLEIRQQLPKEALAAPGDSLTAAWRSGRLASLPLAAPSGQLVLHLATHESRTIRAAIGSLMKDYAGVAIWANNVEAIAGLNWLIEAVESGPPRQWGVLITRSEGAAAAAYDLVEGRSRWRLNRIQQSELSEVLRLLAAAGA